MAGVTNSEGRGAVVQMYTRVGLGAGAIGFVVLFSAQLATALGSLSLLPLIGVLAGLGMAKWLPHDWYGRQFMAGMRAGLLASAVAAVGCLASLTVAGPHAVRRLADASHVWGFRFAAPILSLSPLGWVGAALVLALAAGCLGTAAAGLTTLVFAFDKTQRALQVVSRAREAAQRSQRLTSPERPTQRLSTPPSGVILGRQSGWDHPAPPLQMPSGPLGGRENRLSAGAGGPSGPARQDLHEALAAWADASSSQEDAATKRPTEAPETPPAPRKGSEKDNWLC